MKNSNIGICTLFTGYNFGSALQAYATKTFLEDNGYNPKILKLSGSLVRGRDIRISKLCITFIRMIFFSKHKTNFITSYTQNNKENINYKTVKEFDDFYNNFLNPLYISYFRLKFNYQKKFSKFICGSDQIWNSTAFYVDPFYFLRFTNKDKRIAYAPSFGKDYVPNYNKRIIGKYLQGFINISIREESGVEIINNLGHNKNAIVCLDPIFLLSKNDWVKKINLDNYRERNNIILLYFLNKPTNLATKFINNIEIQKNKKVISINRKIGNIDVVYGGPEKFLELMNEANMIITDSFHGVAFSINFEKNFYVFDRNYADENQSTRIKSLLNKINLTERFDAKTISKKAIDYKNVNLTLKNEILKSKKFLLDSLRGK